MTPTGIAEIQAEIEALVAARMRMRDNGADPDKLEANRIAIADLHRSLARAMAHAWKEGWPIPEPVGRTTVKPA